MSKECIYDVCWQGICKKPTVEGTDFCEDHLGKICSCGSGKQVIGDCSLHAGSFICGASMCEDCKTKHQKSHRRY